MLRSALGVASSIILSSDSCRKSTSLVGSSGSPENFGIGMAITVIGCNGIGAVIGEGLGLGVGVLFQVSVFCLVGFNNIPTHREELSGHSGCSGEQNGEVPKNLSDSSSASLSVLSVLSS